jgi:hypothetical protein
MRKETAVLVLTLSLKDASILPKSQIAKSAEIIGDASHPAQLLRHPGCSDSIRAFTIEHVADIYAKVQV